MPAGYPNVVEVAAGVDDRLALVSDGGGVTHNELGLSTMVGGEGDATAQPG
jgi:hypothetical protein